MLPLSMVKSHTKLRITNNILKFELSYIYNTINGGVCVCVFSLPCRFEKGKPAEKGGIWHVVVKGKKMKERCNYK